MCFMKRDGCSSGVLEGRFGVLGPEEGINILVDVDLLVLGAHNKLIL